MVQGAINPETIWTRRRSPSETSCMCQVRSTSLFDRVGEGVRIAKGQRVKGGGRTEYRGDDLDAPCAGSLLRSRCTEEGNISKIAKESPVWG